eukprot:SAG31_NODE_298_length_18125_cov_27.373350_15_plen_81_part_00
MKVFDNLLSECRSVAFSPGVAVMSKLMLKCATCIQTDLTFFTISEKQLEYVDLVFCHRPDPRTPVEEVVRGMNFLIDKGV